MVMDNLSAHKPARVRELIESRACELIYLPAYSPDFNPIEEAFAKIKDMLRQAGAPALLLRASEPHGLPRMISRQLGE